MQEGIQGTVSGPLFAEVLDQAAGDGGPWFAVLAVTSQRDLAQNQWVMATPIGFEPPNSEPCLVHRTGGLGRVHSCYGLPWSAFARMRPVLVLPVPRGPEKR